MTLPSCCCCNRTFRSQASYTQYLMFKQTTEQLRKEVAEMRGEGIEMSKRDRHAASSAAFRQNG